MSIFVITAKQVEKIILADGWTAYNQNGSHRQYKHPIKKGRVTIPFHKGDLPIMTFKSIFKQAGLDYRNYI